MATYGPRELAEEVGAVTGLGAEKTRRLWSAVGRLADGTLAAGKGLSIPGLGRWTYLRTSNVHEEFGMETLLRRTPSSSENQRPRAERASKKSTGGALRGPQLLCCRGERGLSKDEAKATVAAVAEVRAPRQL